MPLLAVSIFGESSAGHKRIDFLPDGTLISGHQFPTTTALDETLNRSLVPTDRTIFLNREEVEDGFLTWIGLYHHCETSRGSAGGKGAGIWLHNSVVPGEIIFSFLKSVADKVSDKFFLGRIIPYQWPEVDEDFSHLIMLKEQVKVVQPTLKSFELPYKFGLVDLTLLVNRRNSVAQWLTAVQDRNDLFSLKGIYISPGTAFCQVIRTKTNFVDLNFELEYLASSKAADQHMSDNFAPEQKRQFERDEYYEQNLQRPAEIQLDDDLSDYQITIEEQLNQIRSNINLIRADITQSSEALNSKIQGLKEIILPTAGQKSYKPREFMVSILLIFLLLFSIAISSYSAWSVLKLNRSIFEVETNSILRFNRIENSFLISFGEIAQKLSVLPQQIIKESDSSNYVGSLPKFTDSASTASKFSSSPTNTYQLVKIECLKAIKNDKRKVFSKVQITQILQICAQPPH